MTIELGDLTKFGIYANRERSLLRSMRSAEKYGNKASYEEQVAVLRELNLKFLVRETKRDLDKAMPEFFTVDAHLVRSIYANH